MTYRVVIADGERAARRRASRRLAAHRDFRVVAEADSGPEVADCVRREKPDLLVLDVQLPGCSGLDALRSLDRPAIPITIFATVFDQDLLDAFESSGVGYLLKPYSEDRFDVAVRQATRILVEGWREIFEKRVTALLQRSAVDRKLIERIAVRDGERARMVAVNVVDLIEAEAGFVKVHVGEQQYWVRMGMQALEDRLDPAQFLRLGRSCMVRVDRVARLEPDFPTGDIVVLHDETRLKVGKTYRAAVRERLEGRLQGTGGVFFSPVPGA